MQGPGRRIAISSGRGKWGVGGGQAAYCASKAGVHGLVRAAAVELGPRQITCNAVCPAWVDTEMAQARFRTLAAEAGKTPDAIAIQARHQLPARRFVEVDEVAGLVSFLCSPAGAMITGQAISICGGATAFAG
jgi:NAD(P)-dependent dehydrogenase (short-subunit alcohol dehydrogenase family)